MHGQIVVSREESEKSTGELTSVSAQLLDGWLVKLRDQWIWQEAKTNLNR
jgi:hypothetical protein